MAIHVVRIVVENHVSSISMEHRDRVAFGASTGVIAHKQIQVSEEKWCIAVECRVPDIEHDVRFLQCYRNVDVKCLLCFRFEAILAESGGGEKKADRSAC